MSHKCDKCGKEFKTIGYLNRHQNAKTCTNHDFIDYVCRKTVPLRRM